MSEPGNLVYFNGTYEDLCKQVSQSKHLCVVDFFGTWCPPCQRLLQMLPDIAKAFPNVTFMKVDIDKNEDLAGKYSISSVPHIKFFKATSETSINEVGSVLGCKPDAIREKCQSLQ